MKIIGALKIKANPHLQPGLSQKDEIEKKKTKSVIECNGID